MAKNIEPALKLVSDYLKLDGGANFVIPEYQRGYSWSITECDKLWQDIEAFIETGGSDPYFFGTIIVDCSKENELSLIDGQQRTTTFLLLLKALLANLSIKISATINSPTTAPLLASLEESRNVIMEILYKANAKKRIAILGDWDNAKNIKILENKSINELHKDEVEVIIGEKEIEEAERKVTSIRYKRNDNKYTNYFRNYKYFYEKLKDFDSTKLDVFAETFLKKCQIIEIRSWQIEQAITMFNSLNSTGMPLADADIISAQLYSNAGEDKETFNELWKSISKLASDLNSRKIANIDAFLQQFMYINRAVNKEYIKDKSVDITTPGLRRYYTDGDEYGLKTPRKLLNEPMDLCEKLEKIARIWDKIRIYPVAKLLMKFNENIKLFLVSYLYRYNADELTPERTLEIGECLLRLFAVLELVDNGYSSRNFKTFLFGENIKLVDAKVPIEEIKRDFDAHINKNWNEDLIKRAIAEYDKNVLVYLNEYLYAKGKGAKFDFEDNVNIEHIMPASGRNISSIREDAKVGEEEFAILVNKIGNKILLEEDINKSIGRAWFKTKLEGSVRERKGYNDSKYVIATELTRYPKETWEKADIEKATEKAAGRIAGFILGKE